MDGTDGLALFTLATVGVFLVSPQGVASSSGYPARAPGPVPEFYGIVLWLSAQDLPARLVRATAVVALVGAAGFVVLRMPAYLELSSRANDYLSVASVSRRGPPCSRRTSTRWSRARFAGRTRSSRRPAS